MDIPNTIISTPDYLLGLEKGQAVLVPVGGDLTGGKITDQRTIATTYADSAGIRSVPYVLAQSAIPIILAPSGLVATNGFVLLGTALPAAYPYCWIYLPAGAVLGGAAGLYYCNMVSTTLGAIYPTFVNPATQAFTPYIASSATLSVGSNSPFTQTTGTDITLINLSVPGACMGANGSLRTAIETSYPATAGNKTWVQKFGGVLALAFNNAASAVARNGNVLTRIMNRSTQQLQVSSTQYTSSGVNEATNEVRFYTTIDTSVSQPLVYTGQIAVATDYIALESFVIEVLPG